MAGSERKEQNQVSRDYKLRSRGGETVLNSSFDHFAVASRISVRTH